ncbi:MAG: polysaccharide deacetylase family protein [Bacteroidetes bacterium]|nr:polysaccharide deacetylase family protein [Bacteroidota bacterium]
MNVPFFVQKIFGSVTWRMPSTDPDLFLTFDDGPHPEVTTEILAILKTYNASATFFCTGENILKHPAVFKNILSDGHTVGNHTFHHLNGWKTNSKIYFEDVEKCQEVIDNMIRKPEAEVKSQKLKVKTGIEISQPSTLKLFRPPYGKLTPVQHSMIKKNYSVIMWNVLSKDYDRNLCGEQCSRNVINHAGNGSIVVFHDSEKAADRVLYALPSVLDYFSERNFSFKAIV